MQDKVLILSIIKIIQKVISNNINNVVRDLKMSFIRGPRKESLRTAEV